MVESHDIIANDIDDLIEDAEEMEETPTKLTFNIIFVTAEAAPYSKTGGLGDVCGSLPMALAARGHRVMVVSPMYLTGGPSDEKYANAVDLDMRATVHCFGDAQEVAFYHEYRAGVDWVRTFHTFFLHTFCFRILLFWLLFLDKVLGGVFFSFIFAPLSLLLLINWLHQAKDPTEG